MLSHGPKVFKLKMGEREDSASRDQLKPQKVDPLRPPCVDVGALPARFFVTHQVLLTNVPGGLL